MSFGREITIVLQLNGSKASGNWRYQFGEGEDAEVIRKVISVSGAEQEIPWGNDCWENLFREIQFDMASDQCRILIVSDHELKDHELPRLECAMDWELGSVSDEIPQNVKQGTRLWVLNGVDLKGRFKEKFPQSAGIGERETYVYTVPCIDVPEISGKRTPLSEVYHITMVGSKGKA